MRDRRGRRARAGTPCWGAFSLIAVPGVSASLRPRATVCQASGLIAHDAAESNPTLGYAVIALVNNSVFVRGVGPRSASDGLGSRDVSCLSTALESNFRRAFVAATTPRPRRRRCSAKGNSPLVRSEATHRNPSLKAKIRWKNPR